MCVVSAMGDHYDDFFKKRYPNSPWTSPYPYPTIPPFPDTSGPQVIPIPVPDQAKRIADLEEQVRKLREDVLEMKEVLKVAAEYDKRTSQPHCEHEEKVALLKKIAEFVGVDLSEVFEE